MNDKAQSVLDKLRNKARISGKNFQLILQLFCQEEFLRRIGKSKYNRNLILKGGLLIYSLSEFTSRPTMDIDFLLRSFPNELTIVEKMIHEIIMTTTGNEYVIFQINRLESILMHRKYKGIRINLTAKIKNTRTPFHIDIGIEDVIIPKPLYRNIPVQLDHFESPIINTYSLESTIAEKIDAIINRMEFSSRMKDYYDIYYLATMYRFDGRQLQEALYETLQKRQTSYERDTLDKIQLFHKNKDIQIMWNNFIRGTLKEEISLEKVLEVIYRFLNPIFNAIISETEFFGQWNRNKYH